jgi:hypothetical protein
LLDDANTEVDVRAVDDNVGAGADFLTFFLNKDSSSRSPLGAEDAASCEVRDACVEGLTNGIAISSLSSKSLALNDFAFAPDEELPCGWDIQ